MLRHFHSAATVTMVSTLSLMSELRRRGFRNLGMWTRGVDTELFAPHRAIPLDLPRPVFLTAGRIAVEKNLEAFLSLDLPGSKVVVGDGPQEAELQRRFPHATFLGLRSGPELAGLIASADVFVFPSLTDTFGVVQLEALACGIPVAAFPVTGPKDVIGNHPVGVLNDDLRAACLDALKVPREGCRAFALTRSWETSARQFIDHVSQIAVARSHTHRATWPVQASAQDRISGSTKSAIRNRKASRGLIVAKATDIEKNAVEKAYDRWAPVYDLVFGPVFERGRRAAIVAAERIGGRILEVGVGTGISLPDYSRANRIFGVDISDAMLARHANASWSSRTEPRRRTRSHGRRAPDFPDDSFDVVVAQYVVTAVPNPEAALDEFARVLKPGGEIVILSRVGAEAGLRQTIEHWFAAAARKLGWRTEFPWERYAQWACANAGCSI